MLPSLSLEVPVYRSRQCQYRTEKRQKAMVLMRSERGAAQPRGGAPVIYYGCTGYPYVACSTVGYCVAYLLFISLSYPVILLMHHYF
jgi:hypothetical protein